MDILDLATVNHYVLAKQHLTPAARGQDVVQVARDVGGLHATAASTPHLALFARMVHFAKADLERALWDARTLAKLRCVRGTVYAHPVDLLPMFHAATAAFLARDVPRYLAMRGTTPDEFARLSAAVLVQLRGRALTATAVKQALGTQADVSAVLGVLCDRGVLVRARPAGGWRDNGHTYALWSEQFPDIDPHALDQATATRQLVLHYLAAFGPAAEGDIVWWTGLGQRVLRAELEGAAERIARVTVAGLEGEFLVLRSELPVLHGLPPQAGHSVALLPVLDPYPMGYKQRARYLDAGVADHVFDRSGNITSTILVDGRVVGVWDSEADVAAVKYLLFAPVEDEIRDEIEAQAARVGAFIHDRAVEVSVCSEMTPLTQRSAGGMMSPLKGCQRRT